MRIILCFQAVRDTFLKILPFDFHEFGILLRDFLLDEKRDRSVLLIAEINPAKRWLAIPSTPS